MENKKFEIWVGDKDLNRDPEFVEQSKKEFNQYLPIVDNYGDNRSLNVHSNRRDFLKLLGFSLTAATVAAGCEIPLKRAIPYVVKPDEIVPGVANYYASSIIYGGEYCSVLVKTREGRPIKIEGNALSPVTYGGTSARAQAVVLSLYDVNRFRNPKMKDGETWKDISWSDLDGAVGGALNTNSRIRILASTIMSPTSRHVLAEFRERFPNTRVVQYDEVSSAALLKANEACFGQKAVPDMHFDKAKVIVGIQADFLGTWISPVEYAHKYSKNRKIKDHHAPEMSRHYQIESFMSLTGSNADNRIPVKPSELGSAIAHLYNAVAGRTGGARINAPALSDKAQTAVQAAADALLQHRGESLVVCGTNNVGEQVLVNRINDLLGNYGRTLDFTHANMMRMGDESEVQDLIREMNAGSVDAVMIWGANPSYSLPNRAEFNAALAKVPFRLSFAGKMDETTDQCQYVAPGHHVLESWGDVEAKRGSYSLIQPTIAPLFDTRQIEHSMLVWCGSANLGEEEQPFYTYLRERWHDTMFPLQGRFMDFKAFWDHCLHDGIYQVNVDPVEVTFSGDVQRAATNITKPQNQEMEVSFYESIGLGGGQYAENPWLMEMPDPISRCAWHNYLAIPLAFDGVRKFVGLNDLEDGDIAELTVGGQVRQVPVIKQFGQMEGTLAIALGYGRTKAGACGTGVGVDVVPWLHTDANGLTQYFATGASVSSKVAEEAHFACVQYHHTMGVQDTDAKTGETINADEAATVYATMLGSVQQGYQGSLVNRTIIRKSHIDDVETFIHDLEHERAHHQELNAQSLYPGFDELYQQGHHWGMHVDLNACIGCGACTIACMAENNVPVVGKKEVSRHHEMTWLRIDRYYYGDADNPKVVYQPMMCQHCDNAPCENVCPVNASNHSAEGINQMAYNRCVGTRYCANNCPYKVRRFNWLDYTTNDLWPINEPSLGIDMETPFYADNLTRMVLNPDVTVRARGVMEKCSFCYQRIQEGKLTAKVEGRKLRDADVRTACQTACPTGAITFGDFNNAEGELNQKLTSPLNYIVLEETNVRSSVNYSAKIYNSDKSLDA